MFTYHVKTALVSIRRNPVLSALMVLAIGLGISVFLSLYTGYHLLQQDPLPEKSDRVYRVLMDSWGIDFPSPMSQPDEPNFLMTYIDAVNLRRSDIPTHQSAMYRATVYLHPERSPDTLRPGQEQLPVRQDLRLAYNDFFPMFDVPFLFGGPWSDAADENAEPVMVLSRDANQALFNGEDSVGRRVFVERGLYTVVGVLDAWRPTPLFYNMLDAGIGTNEPAELFAPFMLGDVNEWRVAGMNSGWKNYEGTSWAAWTASEQTWLQYWAQLDDADQKNAYLDFMDAYAADQKALGRFPRDPVNNQLYDIPKWVRAATQQISGAARGFLMIGGLFLLICVTNLVSMLLGKFLEGNRETALRRALGAPQSAIFSQRLIEVGMLGVAGGVLGLVFTQALLVGIRRSFEIPEAYASLNFYLFSLALVMALLAGVAAGILPAWRACRVPPASHLNA